MYGINKSINSIMRFEGEWSQQTNYLDNKVTFTDKGELLDHNDMPVMMKWEAPIMEDAADLICYLL